MNAMDSIFLPRFTIGENAFDAFHDEMGRYGKKVAVIHGERAWKAARICSSCTGKSRSYDYYRMAVWT